MRTNTTGRGWTPPHCPNPKCRYHKHFQGPWPWRRRGSYRRKRWKHPVPRFQCRACNVTFSTQTFSTTYWLKKPWLLKKVFGRVVGCMCNRQIARDVGCSPETVNRLVARLGRHSMLLHRKLSEGTSLEGPLVVDGFESFEYSQFHPIHHHLAVEAKTDFWIYHTDSELRRKGSMTPAQKKRRAQLEATLGRPDPASIRKDMRELLEVSLAGREGEATVLSDEHPAYPRAIRDTGLPIRHEVTNSQEPRTGLNPLFPINLLDLLVRHSQSNHKRETIAFSKRRQASAERLSILQVWRNYMKSRREKRPGQTPAMAKGLLKRPLRVKEFLRERIFIWRLPPLPPRWQQYYDRVVETREFATNRRHALRFAY